MTAARRLLGSSQGLTLLETAAVMLIVAIITVPLVAVAWQLIVLPVKWQENIGAVREARQVLHLVASDARQAACFTEGDSGGDYGTFTWTDYTEPPEREFRVHYYLDTAQTDGPRILVRKETVDALPSRRISIGDVEGFKVTREDRLIRAEVRMPSRLGEGPDASLLQIAALMRPGGPATADC